MINGLFQYWINNGSESSKEPELSFLGIFSTHMHQEKGRVIINNNSSLFLLLLCRVSVAMLSFEHSPPKVKLKNMIIWK